MSLKSGMEISSKCVSLSLYMCVRVCMCVLMYAYTVYGIVCIDCIIDIKIHRMSHKNKHRVQTQLYAQDIANEIYLFKYK